MIDNFNIIRTLIDGKTSRGEFYFLQIYKRKKDNPGQNKDMYLIDNFFIKDAKDLMDKKDRIIELCELNNARAYIRLNKRSERKIALQTLRLIADNIASDNYDIKNCYLSCCGSYHSDPEKSWLLDYDDLDINGLTPIMDYIDTLQPIGTKSIGIIKTKNGYHLITKPFRLDEFRKQYPTIDLHKDNPTLLYCK